MGEKAPILILLLAAIHELAEDSKKQALSEKTEHTLPDSAPVLNELWREGLDVTHDLNHVFSVINLWCDLRVRRVAFPGFINSQDIDENKRSIQGLWARPRRVMTLLKPRRQSHLTPR